MEPDRQDETAIGALEALLVETFGTPLLAYLCATDEATIRARLEGHTSLPLAAETALTRQLGPLARTVAARVAVNPGLPRSLSLAFLSIPTKGDEFGLGAMLRQNAGIPVPLASVERVEGDLVKLLLTRIAIDAFPILLAPHEGSWPRPHLSLYNHPLRQRLQSALADDRALRRLFPEEDTGGLGHRGEIYSSLGHGGTYQDLLFAETFIGSAWDAVRMTKQYPTLESLLAQIDDHVDVLREAALGHRARVAALTVFTGFTTRNGQVISTPWGTLRPLHDWERRFAPRSLEGMVSGTQSDGSDVTISYSGEMVLESDIPFDLAVARHQQDVDWTWPVATDGLQRQIEGMQLACALVSHQSESWVMAKVAWAWKADPFSHGTPPSWWDTRLGPGFMPTVLSDEACAQLSTWTHRVGDNWHPGLDIAIRRFLSAGNARTDMADRLVDSVIVWENLFGTSQGEPRFRISAAMAWLLCSAAADREVKQQELRNLYDFRSKIVHGSKHDEATLGEAANKAMSYARDALAALMRDRPDVMALPDGASRSSRLIMGG